MPCKHDAVQPEPVKGKSFIVPACPVKITIVAVQRIESGRVFFSHALPSKSGIFDLISDKSRHGGTHLWMDTTYIYVCFIFELLSSFSCDSEVMTHHNTP